MDGSQSLYSLLYNNSKIEDILHYAKGVVEIDGTPFLGTISETDLVVQDESVPSNLKGGKLLYQCNWWWR